MTRPRATLAQVAQAQTWAASWALVLSVWLICGFALLATDVGQQALVDERVRVIEGFGGTVSDAEYAGLQRQPPWWIYLVSGGRLLLFPPVTLLVAVLLWAAARWEGARATLAQALAITVHASVVLVIGQIAATPLHYIRESLTSPLNLAAILPGLDDGTAVTRFFGVIDLFALWWAGLLALGLAVLTARPMRRYLWPIVGLFVVFAAVLAVVLAAAGGA